MASNTLRGASADANEQIRELRGQVDQLMRSRVTPAVNDAVGRAQDYAHQAGNYSRAQAEVLSEQVKEMPIASVLIAAAAGYLLGRLTR